VLDIGSSTGGFTDFALSHGAKKVIAVEKGTLQMNPRLAHDKRVELHEKTDVFRLRLKDASLKKEPSLPLPEKNINSDVEMNSKSELVYTNNVPDIILADVSFLSLTKILKYARLYLTGPNTALLVMLKPQFEAKPYQLVNGIVKNSKMRREIIKNFEDKIKSDFKILAKQDNLVAGRFGNVERFYLLKTIVHSR
jgi:23S rRNA (cytidine1920-2'-O)/16S rRNA (cytidine1409-2'-O)-methyltransferase